MATNPDAAEVAKENRRRFKAFNERIKLLTVLVGNGGVALIGGAISVMYSNGAPSWNMSMAALIGILLVIIAVSIVGDIRSEE